MLVWQNFLVATWQTVYTVLVSGTLSIAIGLVLGVILFLTQPQRWWSQPTVHHILGGIVNVVRSVPFIILLIAIVPFTRLIVGTSIGINAAVVPLIIAAIPFYARLAEGALSELNPGLLEAAEAMGFSHVRAIRKILLPAVRAALVKAAALTYISLVGYAAMAGAVGGGGLGQLAIDYGYERFNPQVMLLTVAILVVLVQLIQWGCDRLAHSRRSLRAVAVCLAVAVPLALLGQNWPTQVWHGQRTVKLGVMSGLEADAIAAAVPLMQHKYGVHLKLVQFDDYAMPNAALSSGQIDANLFQHKPFLDADVKAHGYKLKIAAKTFLFPLGFYSKKIHNIKQLPQYAVVAVASDPSNQGRALILLQKHHLIRLKPQVGLTPSVLDIVSNPHHLQIKTMNTAQLPRVLQDADLVAVNNAFLKHLGLAGQHPILREDTDVPYINVLVVRQHDKRHALWQQLAQVLHSPAVVNAYTQRFAGLVKGW